MTDEATMLRAYAANYPDDTDRLILADWLEERGDIRGTWLREPLLARLMGPALLDPRPQLVALAADDTQARKLLGRWGNIDLSPWEEDLRHPDTRRQRAALAALRDLGEGALPAVPRLLDLLADAGPSVGAAILGVLENLGPASDAALIAAYGKIWVAGYAWGESLLATVARRGPEAPSLEVLLDLLRNGDRGDEAAEHLLRLGPPVFERLLAMPMDFDNDWYHPTISVLLRLAGREGLLAVAQDAARRPATRRQALRYLVRSLEDVEDEVWQETLPQVVAFLSDPVDDIALTASEVLGEFPDLEPTLADLIQLAQEGDTLRRGLAVQNLRYAGSAALPELRILAESEDPEVRSLAGDTLRDLEPRDRRAEMQARLRSADPLERVAAVSELRWWWPREEALELHRQALADADAAVRQQAIDVGLFIGEGTREEELALRRFGLRHGSATARLAFLGNLRSQPDLARILAPDLTEQYDIQADPPWREALLRALAAGQPLSTEFQTLARRALTEADGPLRRLAADLLCQRVMQLLPEPRADLLRLAAEEPAPLGDDVVRWLSHQNDRSADLIEAVRQRLHRYPHQPGEAIQALVVFKYRPVPADLEPILHGLDLQTVDYAGALLAGLGMNAEPAVSARLHHPDARIRRMAIRTLGRILPPEVAVERLRSFFSESREFVEVMCRVARDLGPAALGWLPELLDVLARCDSPHDFSVGVALQELMTHSPAVAEGLRVLADDEDPVVRENAASVLRAHECLREHEGGGE